MATNFENISIGFAEFVSQLIHETFDAIIDAQNYQQEKYFDIQRALSATNDLFKSQFLTESEIEDFQLTSLGIVPQINTEINDSINLIFKELSVKESIESYVNNKKLTIDGTNRLNKYLIDKLINEKRSKLDSLINHSELGRLMVDSGEISAKFELTCLNEVQTEPIAPTSRTKSTLNTEKLPSKSSNIKDLSKDNTKGIRVIEFNNVETNRKTILIDRASLKDNTDVSRNISTTRIVANPVSASSTSNLFSQVTIKFKTK